METLSFKNLAGIILLPARADGVEGWMAFDTGAMQTSLHSRYFPDQAGEAKQVAFFHEGMAVGSVQETTLRELSLGAVTVRDLPVIRMDMAYVEDSLRAVEPELRFLGSVGMEAFGHAPVLLDYEHSTVIVSPDVSVEGAEKIPLSMEALPVVTLELAGEPHRFVLDTGANTCLLAAELAGRIDAAPLPDAPGVYVLPEVRAGTRVYPDINAVFTDLTHIRDRVEVDGVIGGQILSARPALLDFPHAAVYLF